MLIDLQRFCRVQFCATHILHAVLSDAASISASSRVLKLLIFNSSGASGRSIAVFALSMTKSWWIFVRDSIAEKLGKVGIIEDYKITDGNGVGFVVTFEDKSSTWFFEDELKPVS